MWLVPMELGLGRSPQLVQFCNEAAADHLNELGVHRQVQRTAGLIERGKKRSTSRLQIQGGGSPWAEAAVETRRLRTCWFASRCLVLEDFAEGGLAMKDERVEGEHFWHLWMH